MKRFRIAFPRADRYLALSFILPAAFMLAAYYLNGGYPFGDRAFTISDMSLTYLPMFQSLRHILSGEVSPFFSWNKTLGTPNIVSFMSYDLTNPLALLLLPFKNSYTPVVLAYFIALKYGLCGLNFALFARNVVKSDRLAALIFSLCYALCGYNLTYVFNIMWLDAVAFLPLAVWGVERVYRGESPALLYLSTLVMIFLNYYAGALALIFAGMYALTRMNVPVLEKGKILIKLLCWVLLAVGALAAFLLPVFLLIRENRGAAYDALDIIHSSPLLVLFKLFPDSFDHYAANSAAPNIYCGLPALLLFFSLFFIKSVPPHVKITAFLLSFILLAGFLTNFNYVMHMFQINMGFAFRYSFTFSFLMVSGAAYAHKRLKDLRLYVPAAAAAASLAALRLVLERPEISPKLFDYLTEDKMIMYFALLALYLLGLYMYKRGVNPRLLSFCGAGLLCLELFLNALLSYNHFSWFGEGFYPRYEEYLGLAYVNEAENLKNADKGFYRMDIAYNELTGTMNEPAFVGYRGVNYFGSDFNIQLNETLSRLGMVLQSFNIIYNSGEVLDDLLSIKYTLGIDAERNLIKKENHDALSVGFMVSPDFLEKTEGEEPLLVARMPDKIAEQTRLISRLLGRDVQLYKPLTHSFSKTYKDFDKDVKINAREAMVKRAFASERYVFTPNSESVYVQAESENFEMDPRSPRNRLIRLRVNGVYLKSGIDYGKTVYNDPNMLMRVDGLTPGRAVCLEASRMDPMLTMATPRLNVYELDESVWREALSELGANQLEVTGWTADSLSGVITADRDGLMFTSIPYDKGFHATVDGRRAEIKAYDQTFICLPLPAGRHEIKFKYTPRGFYAGLCVSAGSVACAAFYFIRRGKNRPR
ncbi:MAG: YfhO family protein [Clostridiales bacterium]|jgi:uncharacterized membrane protein YfhO|nr:YfhO family protein [Clostridiales bacterium]